MKTGLVSCAPTDTVARCAELMKERRIGFVPVLDADRRVLGVVTDRDLVLRVLAPGAAPSVPVSEVMTKEVVSCRSGDTLGAAEEKMALRRKSRVVVIDAEGRCIGVISLSDIAQAENRARTGKLLFAVTRREVTGPVAL
ncbi:MAG TPA: CBS domain-containing protein [Vicinamibacteria bacterium]